MNQFTLGHSAFVHYCTTEIPVHGVLPLCGATGFKDYKNDGFSRSQFFTAHGYFLTRVIRTYSKRLRN